MVSNEEQNGSTNVTAPKQINGNFSSSSSAESENSVDFEPNDKSTTIRVGEDYQADLRNYEVLKNPHLNNIKEKELLVWKPNSAIEDKDLDSFLFTACSKCSYTIQQALSLLCVQKYDIQTSLMTLNQFVPQPNEWSDEDKIVFEQAYNYHGKNFYKIKQCLPDKSQASLVNFYYMWKKNRGHVSLMQQQIDQPQTSKSVINSISENGNSNAKNTENGQSNEADVNNLYVQNVKKICSNCDIITDDLQSTPKGGLCNQCHSYYKSTSGLMRPDGLNFDTVNLLNISNYKTGKIGFLGSDYKENDLQDKRAQNVKEARNFLKTQRKPPKGIYLNIQEIVNLAEFDFNITFDMLDKRLFNLKKEVQTNKQDIESMIGELANEEEKTSIIEIDPDLIKIEANSVPTPCWTAHEIALAIQGFNKYGSDFNAIAQVIGSKTENSIKSFYQYHKENYNLESLIANPSNLKEESLAIFNEIKKQNRADIPTSKLETEAIVNKLIMSKNTGDI